MKAASVSARAMKAGSSRGKECLDHAQASGMADLVITSHLCPMLPTYSIALADHTV